MLIVVLTLSLLLFIALEKLINKLLGVEKKKISTTSGKNIDRRGRIILAVIFLCTLPFVITKGINSNKWYWIVYLILLLGFQAILEWKHLNSKQYVSTLIFLILGVMLIFFIAYLI
ncbi:hypothetical protein A8F95_21240 [Bacillus wudalianchiensis]|uniref:DUF4181 domain-containing protein n=2 Tax=Pseudobacillus wudalianchiensis TaxID=1743143 RepID=A0A1B9B2F0_9BACI|nr:hypothetical protein A8F95_21240 [Bacillus wudalianchiensis]